ncbi:MAG: hypothetical protein ACT4QF_02735 [Sporichthyaceae bacterium]
MPYPVVSPAPLEPTQPSPFPEPDTLPRTPYDPYADEYAQRRAGPIPGAVAAASVRGFSVAGPPRAAAPGAQSSVTRSEIVRRAASWVLQKVPYSQARWWTDSAGSYRQDCSGYVAMAWATDQRVNYWTGNLARISERIASSSLRPGDLLNLPRKHVVIFAGWTNPERTRFDLFEQYRTGTTPRFLRNAQLAFYLDRGYGALRYRNVVSADPSSDRLALTGSEAPAAGETPESILAGLPAEEWSPEEAERYTADVDPSTVPADPTAPSTIPAAVPDATQSDLVAEQRAVDLAETQRASMSRDEAPAGGGQTAVEGSGWIAPATLGGLFLGAAAGTAAHRRLVGRRAERSAHAPPGPPRLE